MFFEYLMFILNFSCRRAQGPPPMFDKLLHSLGLMEWKVIKILMTRVLAIFDEIFYIKLLLNF